MFLRSLIKASSFLYFQYEMGHAVGGGSLSIYFGIIEAVCSNNLILGSHWKKLKLSGTL